MNLNGQWLGRYTGTNQGILVVDLDDMESHFEGIACAYEDNTALPSTFVHLRTPDKQKSCQMRLQLQPIDPRTGEVTTWPQIAVNFPTLSYPTFADISLNLQDDVLGVYRRTNIETTGSAHLPRSQAGNLTEYQPLPDVTNWADFKSFVSGLDHRRYIFRGQEQPMRLRTSFHRAGRANLLRYLAEDIQTLHSSASQSPHKPCF